MWLVVLIGTLIISWIYLSIFYRRKVKENIKKTGAIDARKGRFAHAVNSIVKERGQGDKTIEKVPYPQERVEYEFHDTLG